MGKQNQESRFVRNFISVKKKLETKINKLRPRKKKVYLEKKRSCFEKRQSDIETSSCRCGKQLEAWCFLGILQLPWKPPAFLPTTVKWIRVSHLHHSAAVPSIARQIENTQIARTKLSPWQLFHVLFQSRCLQLFPSFSHFLLFFSFNFFLLNLEFLDFSVVSDWY